MRTRSKSYPNNSNVTIPKRQNRKRFPNIVEPEIRTIKEVEPMADRTMEELLQAPTEGYGEAITTHIKNEISRFTQRFEETFGEAWERFKEMLKACPHHGFSKLTQIDTFYNGLNEQGQDSLNAAAGGNLLSKTTREALKIIENKSKVRSSISKLNVSRVNTNSKESSSKTDDRIDKLADQILNLVEIVNKQVITPLRNQSSVCAATGTYNQVSPPNQASNQMAPPGFAPMQNNQNMYNQNQGQGNNFNRENNFQGNEGYRAPMNHAPNFQNQPFQAPNNHVQQGIPNKFSSYMKSNESFIRNMQNQINVLRGDFNTQEENLRRNLNNDIRSILGSFFQNQASTSGTLPSNTIPNPQVTTRSGLAYEGPSIPTNSSPEKVVERETKETTDKEQPNCQGSTAHIQPPVVPIFIPELVVPKTQHKPNIPYLLRINDQRLREKLRIKWRTKVPLNENCSVMLLKKHPEKLGDPGKFLIPCDFLRMDVCYALADLGASINLMPLSIWKKLSLPELTLTRMTFELADRSITHPKGVAEDVFVKVGRFHFPTDFVVVDFEADPRVSLILGRSFLRTGRALIDVYGEEITLRVNDESVTFNLNQTMRYSSTYDDNLVNRIDVMDIACEEYAQDVLDFKYNSKSGIPTLLSNPSFSEENKSEFYKEPIVKSSSPTLTPFGESGFLLEEIKDFLKDESISTGIEDSYYDPEGDILYLEKLLNDDPSQLPPIDLKQAEKTKAKSSIEEPLELELKELPSHLEYAFLEETDKLPMIIVKDLRDDEKEALLKVSKSHTRVIAWKITDIKGIDPRFCTHKILMEEDYKPVVQSQRRVNPKIHEVINKEVIKLLDAEMINPISDSPWVLLLQEFDITIRDKKRSENLAADHLSRLENPHKDVFENKAKFRKEMKCLKMLFKFVKSSMYGVSILWDHSRLYEGIVMTKYGVTHHLATAYTLKRVGKWKFLYRGLKCILKRTVGENRASWSDKLDDALWAVRTAFKTPTGCTPYKLVYEKSCHLPIELEHKAYWALKHANFDLKTTGDHRKLQLNELNELRDQAYDNSLIYKERIKKLHDSKIKNRIFNVGDQVLLFNSRLKIFSGKLKTRWSGPFTITQVFPYGTVELSQPDGLNFKVNGHRVKHYFGGDIPSKVVPDLHTIPMDK
nr:reverse transcriptase domain-containing protein [Tanacetum cinerariifolium]